MTSKEQALPRSTSQQLDADLESVCYRLMKHLKLGRNCTQCEHFHSASEKCNLWGVQPPVHVLVKGCDSFEEHIPF